MPRLIGYRDRTDQPLYDTEHTTMSAITDRANNLRSRLQHELRPHDVVVPTAPYYLRNIKDHKITDTTVSGHAQSVHCRFCGKQFGTLPQLPRHRRGTNTPFKSSGKLYELLSTHLEPCALGWLRLTLARWSTNQMSKAEEDHVRTWQLKYMRTPDDDDGPYERHGQCIPPELAVIWGFALDRSDGKYHRRWEFRMPGIFDSLPQPMGSDMAQNLEVALIAISRMWSS
jgi:hypothetical protein